MLPATANAGLVPQLNWNNFDNFANGTTTTDMPLVDATGAASPVTISFTANDSWNNDDPMPTPTDSNGNDVLMFGCIKRQGAGSAATFTFANVPASTTGWYDLIVYTTSNNDGVRLNTSIGTKRFYTVGAHGWVGGSAVNAAAPGSPAIPARTFRQAKNEIDPSFGGVPDLGNYIRFSGIAPDASGTITLTSTYVSGGDGLGISGLQLINGTAAPVDTTPPIPLVTRTTPANSVFYITFSEALDASAAAPGNFTLNNGATVSAAEFVDAANPTTIKVTTSTLTPGTAYTVTVAGVKDVALNAFSGTANFRTANRATGDVSGFTTTDGYQLNGGAAASGGVLTLTSGANSQTRSVFNTNVVNINNFNARFIYRATGAADGAGFVLQGDPTGAAALGGGGGALGFTGIQNAVGVLLNIYEPNGVGYSVSSDGTTGAGTYTDAGIVLASGDPILVTLSYSQATTTLHVKLQDLTTGTVFEADHNVDIKSVVGGDYAFVGFTGATGGANSVQTIQDFVYSANALVNQPVRILTQPTKIHGLTNTTVQFEVAVSGPATFQWFKGSTAIAGATSATLDVGPLTDADNNTVYHVVVTGGAGTTGNTVTSNDAVLTVGHLEFLAGYMRYDRFDGPTTPAAIEDPAFTDPPSFQTLRTSMSNPTTSPDLNNFADRTYGYFVPATEGDYTFYIASDDGGNLFISTDSDPANKYQIASQARWSNSNEWTVLDGNAPENIRAKRSDQYLQDTQAAAAPVPIHLKANTRYYIEMTHGEGGGGDASMVTFTAFGATPPANGTASALTGNLIGALVLTGESINFTTQPADASVPAATKATFNVAVSNPIAFYQWQKNGVNIPGATSSTYTTDFLSLSDSGAKYRAVVSIPGSSANSAEATLTVTPSSSTAAVPVGAGSINASEVGIEFDTLIDPATGSNPASFTVSGGAVISAAKPVTMSDGTKAFSAVKLTLSTPISGTSANVSIVAGALKDINGNTVAAATLPVSVQKLAHKDIGNLPGDPINPGDAVAAGAGAYDVLAGGTDIFNNADGFHFVYAPVKGDFDVSVRVQYVLPVNNWSAGALMVRDTLNADARQWHVKVTPPAVPTVDGGTGAASFETNRRLLTGVAVAGWSGTPGDKSVAKYPDQFIRLTRTNQTLSVFRKDPVNTDWVLVQEEEIT
ncbi:MAG TPA: hypothetical protein VM680_18040, partial [Verrucomicrobiae bacterium]|nr:hypothetical protein [Verrucomicrobiae bacterium]